MTVTANDAVKALKKLFEDYMGFLKQANARMDEIASEPATPEKVAELAVIGDCLKVIESEIRPIRERLDKFTQH